MYYLTLEVAQVTTGMELAVEAEAWEISRQMNTAEFTTTLVAIAQRVDKKKYLKHPRGPKKPLPHKLSGKKQTHVSTARILAMRE